MQGKYLIIKTEYDEQPLTFPITIQHNSLLSANKIIAAGFFKYENGKFICYGKSESLHIKSRSETDSEILNMYFNFTIL